MGQEKLPKNKLRFANALDLPEKTPPLYFDYG